MISMFALAVGATFTFAQICAFDPSFKTFTVGFGTSRFIAFASLIMCAIIGNLGFECILVWSKNPHNGLLATCLMLLIRRILTGLLRTFAFWTASGVLHQADAIKFETFVLAAIASLTRSNLLPLFHKLIMWNTRFDHFFCNNINPLSLLFFDQVFFLLSCRFWICEETTLSAWGLHQSGIPKFWCCMTHFDYGRWCLIRILQKFILSSLFYFWKIYFLGQRILKFELSLIFQLLVWWISWCRENIMMGAIFFFDIGLGMSFAYLFFHWRETYLYCLGLFEGFFFTFIVEYEFIFLSLFDFSLVE